MLQLKDSLIRLGNFIVLNWEESKGQMLRGKIKKEVANFMTYKWYNIKSNRY